MIGHIEHGSDFGGLFRYLLAEDKGARIIGGSVAGRTPGELTQEFNNCADQRRTTKKPVKHFIVSFSPEDGYVSDEAKARIAKSAVEELGYTYNQYVVVDHHRDDPGHDWNHDHDHIHIAVNMITLDGNRIDDWQDKRKFEEILRQLEVSEQLTTVISSRERKRKALSHGQTQRIKREIKEFKQGERTTLPEIPLSIKLQAAIDKASEDKPGLTTFIGRLQHLGIDVRATISDKGRKRISYQLGDLKVRGSKLHNASFPKLISQRGINFDKERDKPAMDAASLGIGVNIPIEKQVTWSEIDLVSYLPSALANNLPQAQTNPKQKEKQLTSDVEDKFVNPEPPKLTDSKLLEIKSSVEKWLLKRPHEPRREIIQNIQLEINRLERLKVSGEQKINDQVRELEQLGNPRSLLNPFGVTSDIIEQKKNLVRLNQSKLKDIERELTTANNNLERWQKKVQMFQDWCDEPKTQEMQKLTKLLSTPDNIERLNRIEQGSKIYQVKHKGFEIG
ncbi:MAG: relaxase/mobilization nuclease domain-containing protein [Cyanobacteria bacterium P01_A01_bin.40]